MKKSILVLTVYLLFLAVLPGCWDYTEYEDWAQLIGMGFDYDSQTQQTTITIQYPSIQRAGGAARSTGLEPHWIVHAATDKTFLGALTKLQEIVPQRMFYGYVKVLVVGEEAAKNHIMDLVDLFDRTPVMRTSASIVVTEGKAEDVLKTASPAHIASAEEIHKLVFVSRKTGTAFPVTLADFTQMLAVGGWEGAVPRVISTSPAKPPSQEQEAKGAGQEDQHTERDGQNEEQTAKGGTQGNIRFHEKQTGALRISGLAAFHGDKFIGWLDDEEARGYNWIRNNRIQAYKTSVTTGGPDAEYIYYRVLKVNSKIKVHLEDDQPAISVHVKVVADMRKYYRHAGADFLLSEEISEAEKRLADSIRADIDAALSKGQRELKSDIFGFGFAVFRENPRLWKQEYEPKWAAIFPDVPVNVHVDAKVINTGINIRKLFVK